MNAFSISVSQGQTMNISLWSFTVNDRSLGRVRDLISNNVIDVKTSARHQSLLTTVGHKLQVDLRDTGDVDVIFDINGKSFHWCQISGCLLFWRVSPAYSVIICTCTCIRVGFGDVPVVQKYFDTCMSLECHFQAFKIFFDRSVMYVLCKCKFLSDRLRRHVATRGRVDDPWRWRHRDRLSLWI